jgi:hypothetical protein
MRSIFMILTACAGLAGCGDGPEKPEPSVAVAAPEPSTAQPNLLQTQADALQKAEDMKAQLEEAEKQRLKELDEMTGN